MSTLARAESIAIWGFGREGRAALDFVRQECPHVPVTILNDTPLAQDTSSLPVLTGAAVARSIADGAFDVIIRSPGISLYRPEMATAKARGIRCTTVTNLWFEQAGAAPVIAVTGTKGKSTTASLLHHMLRASGADAALLGNVGLAALGQKPARDYTVLELSSYQIADLEHAPKYAVVTNLYPEHAPWHGSAERYFSDKLRLLTVDPQTVGFCNAADERLHARLAGRPHTHWYNQPSSYHVAGGQLCYRETPVDTGGFRLKGAHNLVNLAAACAVLDALGIEVGTGLASLGNFEQLPHRLQEFTVGNDILCVDDSISTVQEATIAAIDAFRGRDIVLLLGGTERGQDYRTLYTRLASSGVGNVILLPANGDRIFRELSEGPQPFDFHLAESLPAAIAEAFRRLSPGSVLLLSPGAPSFGEFTNFEARGAAFQALSRAQADLRTPALR